MVPKCSRCNSSDIPESELAFSKVGKNSWGLVCKKCLESSGTLWNKPGELRWLGSYAGLYDPDTFKLLSSIREANGKKAEKLAENERRYERHNIVLRGFIKLENEDKETLAVIKDLSKGGLRFVSKSEFAVAQIASIRIERHRADTHESTINENIEIVRVIPQSNGTFEMGARFLSAETAGLGKKKNSKNSRHNLLLKLTYKLSQNAPLAKGAVLELGRKSALLLITSEVSKGMKFALQITGNCGLFADQELNAIGRVKRSEMIYSGNFEVLVELSRINIMKR